MTENAADRPVEVPLDQSVDETGQFVGDYLLYLLAAVSSATSAEFHAHIAEEGLRVPEWRVLACLADKDGAMITHLARISLLEQSRLTKIIDQMAERGLVRRQPDPADARRVRVYLTDAGSALSDRLVKDARHHETQVLARLGPADANAIKPILRALLARQEDIDGG